MGKPTRFRSLPDQAYDPRLTDLSRPLLPPSAIAREAGIKRYENKVITNTTPIQLVANVATRVLPYNQSRKGLLVNNRDTAATLFIGFGGSNGSNDLGLAPGGFLLFDFVCPPTEVWLFASANVLATVLDMSQGG